MRVKPTDVKPGQKIAKWRDGTGFAITTGAVERYPAWVQWWAVTDVSGGQIVCREGTAAIGSHVVVKG